jgi:hypothetical protein
MPDAPASQVVMLSKHKFLFCCGLAAAAVFFLGRVFALPTWLLAAEVFATVISLFVFGSFKYQVHKNAITYGMLVVILATFSGLADSRWHKEIRSSGWWPFAREHLLSFEGWDNLIHADTMLFILGLTFFVAVVAQTRLLEGLTFFLLSRFGGRILPTVLVVPNHPYTRHHLASFCRADQRYSSRRDGLHRRHDDMRHMAGIWRAAELNHESQPAAAPQ